MIQSEFPREGTEPMRACYRELHRYKYQLCKPYVFKTEIRGHAFASDYLRIEPDGTLEIFARYAWDGPSGPAPDVPA